MTNEEKEIDVNDKFFDMLEKHWSLDVQERENYIFKHAISLLATMMYINKAIDVTVILNALTHATNTVNTEMGTLTANTEGTNNVN